MSARFMHCPLIRALLAMLPEAEVRSATRQGWHSATFSGERICVRIGLWGDRASADASRFATALPAVEWAIPKGFVADIIVSDLVGGPGGVELTIDALVLDE